MIVCAATHCCTRTYKLTIGRCKHTEWLPGGVTKAFSSIYALHVEDCEGGRSPVIEHWQLKPGTLDSILGNYWLFATGYIFSSGYLLLDIHFYFAKTLLLLILGLCDLHICCPPLPWFTRCPISRPYLCFSSVPHTLYYE